MNASHDQVRSIFEHALGLQSQEERAAFLEQACAGQPALRVEVDSLLEAHAAEGDFFATTVLGPPTVASVEKAGGRIGRYKLLEQIGEGGFGVVWMAEQEEPVHRRVALKVIKLGMDTKEVVARFQAERQALALMEHPHIASVYDGGTTESGRPYFVMELVHGVPITDFCDQNSLNTHERLQLFAQVCHAVQHAHQKGIIHRDLKPSNILVALQDGVPTPKVIDFGIAKATAQPLTDATYFTAFTQFIGTPAYTSPEQAERNGLDIDTRSDVYSLGVLLYELLTGRLPFDPRTLVAAGLDEMRRVIREQIPPKPSTRLSTLAASDLTTVARHRKAPPPKLIHLVRGDLDWIVMKCLEKNRRHRYETASALADDVGRHLRLEPIFAKPPKVSDKAWKFVRRHHVGVGLGAALVLAIIGGTGISIWEACREKRARVLAEKFAADAKDKLWLSYLAQAQANRRTVAAGHRFNTLEAVRKAAAIRPSIELRNEAASALALPDMRVAREWDGNPPGTTGLALAPDGERYARVDTNGTISVRRVRDDHELMVFPGKGAPTLWRIRFSGDGRYVAVGDSKPDPRHVRVCSLEQERVVLDETLPAAWEETISFIPGTSTFVVGDCQGQARCFDLQTGNRWSWNLGRTASTLHFRPDGKQFVVTDWKQHMVAIFDATTGTLVTQLTHPMPILNCGWSADGRRLVAGGVDGQLFIWDMTGKPQLVRTMGQHEGQITWVGFHPGGELVASSCTDGTTVLWSVATGERVCVLPGKMEWLSFTCDGRGLGLFNAGTKMRLIEVEAGDAFRVLTDTNGELGPFRPRSKWAYGDRDLAYLQGLGEFSHDRRWLATGTVNGFDIWNVQTWQRVCHQAGHLVNRVSFLPSDRGLMTVQCRPNEVQEWSVTAEGDVRSPRFDLKHSISFATNPVDKCSFSQDGSIIANAQLGVKVWDRQRDQTVILSPGVQFREVAVAPDGRWIVGVKEIARTLHIWSWPSQHEEKSFATRRAAAVFSGDGRWLLVANEHTLDCWEVGTWRHMQQMFRDDDAATQLPIVAPVCSADGRWAAVAKANDTVELVELPSLQPIVTLQGVPGPPLNFSPDRSFLLVMTTGGNYGVWNLRHLNRDLADMGLGWEDGPNQGASAKPRNLDTPFAGTERSAIR